MSGNDLQVGNVQLTWRKKCYLKKNYSHHHRPYILIKKSEDTIQTRSKLVSTPTYMYMCIWRCMYCTGPFAYSNWLDTHCHTVLILCSASQRKRREVFSCWNNAQAFITQAASGRRTVLGLVGERWAKTLDREQLCFWCRGLSIAPCRGCPGGALRSGLELIPNIALLRYPHPVRMGMLFLSDSVVPDSIHNAIFT